MAKKTSYNEKSHEELVLELAKLKASIRELAAEKAKTGNPLAYRTAKKNIARVMTALQQKALAAN